MSDDTEVQFILFYLFCIYRVFNVNSTLNSHNIIVYYQIQSTLSSHLPTTRLAISVSPQNIFVFSTELGIFSGYESKNYVWYSPIGLCHSAQTVELYTTSFGCDILLVTIQDVNYTIIRNFIRVGRYRLPSAIYLSGIYKVSSSD